MPAQTKIKISDTITPRLKRYRKKFPEVFDKSVKKVGLQLLNWSINGSPNESVRPPILHGVLRGSGSVFYGNELAGTSKKTEGTPAESYNGKKGVLTVGFNTDYAAKLHNSPFKPGPVSEQSGDVAYQWLARHLEADKEDMMKFLAKLLEKEQNDI